MEEQGSTSRWPTADDRMLEDLKSDRRDLEGEVTFMRVTAGLLEQAAAEIKAKVRIIEELEAKLGQADIVIGRLKERSLESGRMEQICYQYQEVFLGNSGFEET